MQVAIGKWKDLPDDWDGINGLYGKTADEVVHEARRQDDAADAQDTWLGVYDVDVFEDQYNQYIDDGRDSFDPRVYWIRFITEDGVVVGAAKSGAVKFEDRRLSVNEFLALVDREVGCIREVRREGILNGRVRVLFMEGGETCYMLENGQPQGSAFGSIGGLANLYEKRHPGTSVVSVSFDEERDVFTIKVRVEREGNAG